MANVKDKIVTVESLKSKHDYDESTYLKKSDALTTLGITATPTELNKLDGVTATTAELNILDGVTATTTELNYMDGVTSNVQTQLNTKVPTSRTINNKALNDDITISAADVGAATSEHTHQYHAVTAHMGTEIYVLPAGEEYCMLPLSNAVYVGDAIRMTNNRIQIGSEVSKVRISAQVCVGSSNRTNKYLAIRRNGSGQIARAQIKLVENTTAQTISIAPIIVDVSEYDLITLDFQGEKDDTIYGGLNLTYITVEKLA